MAARIAAQDSARLRRFRNTSLVAIIVLAVTSGGIRAHAQCVGDCDGNNAVGISELILGVSIALGNQPITVCEAFDCQHTGVVEISCLIQGVNGSLTGCDAPPTSTATPIGGVITLSGSCRVPGTGPHGLKACGDGTPVTAFRCDDRTLCLHQQGLTMIGATTASADGLWSMQVATTDASAAIVLQASIAGAVVFRSIALGSASISSVRGRASDLVFTPVAISPVSEAYVQLLDTNGFENYSDTGTQAVIDAVVQATADLSFENDSPETAVSGAVGTASTDPTVIDVLETARNTPTPTPTPVATPCSTSAPGSIVVFQSLQANAANDPLLSLTNHCNSQAHLTCFYAAEPECSLSAFDLTLVRQESIQWQASVGAESIPTPPANPFNGELVCVEVDAGGAPSSARCISGSLQSDGACPGALISLAGIESNDGDNVLCLGGAANENCPYGPEYDSCPAGIDPNQIETCWSQSPFVFVCGG